VLTVVGEMSQRFATPTRRYGDVGGGTGGGPAGGGAGSPSGPMRDGPPGGRANGYPNGANGPNGPNGPNGGPGMHPTNGRGGGQCTPACETPCRIHLYGPVYQNLDALQNYGMGTYPDDYPGSSSILEWDTPLGAPFTYVTRDGQNNNNHNNRPGGLGGPGGNRGSRGGGGGGGPYGAPGPYGGPAERGCGDPYRQRSILVFFVAFAIFVVALLLAYFFAGSKVFSGVSGCTQADELQQRLCIQSLRPGGETAQVRTLVIIGSLYILIAAGFAMLRFDAGALVALGLAGVIVLLLAVYYTITSPFIIVQSTGGSWLLASFIILIFLFAVAYVYSSRARHEGEDGVSWCC